MLNLDELELLKKNTSATILSATKFMINRGMDKDKKKVRSASPDLEKYGIWPTAEFLEFLMLNDVLSYTSEIVNLIDNMVDFIIDKYNHKEKKWPFTDAPGAIASAITSGHCIYVLKLYISRPFVDYTKAEAIKQIIKEAEEALIADCRRDGSWRILKGDDNPDTKFNYGRFFFTHHAWFGIKKVLGYSDDLPAIPTIRERLVGYVIDASNKLLSEAHNENVKSNVLELSKLICNMSRAIQILSDYEDTNCVAKKKELCSTILQMTDGVTLKSLLRAVAPVVITQLPNSGYTTFSNNTSFDLYFAIKDEPDCSELAQAILAWYLDNIDRDSSCWMISDMNTWPTCEALLVLSDAHENFFAEAIKRNCDNELARVKEKHKKCDGCKKQITEYLKPEKERFNQSMVANIGKVKRTNYITIAITIFIAICAVAALITLSIITELYWLNTLITAAVLPVILQIIFVTRLPSEYFDKMQATQADILKTIEESKDMWENE